MGYVSETDLRSTEETRSADVAVNYGCNQTVDEDIFLMSHKTVSPTMNILDMIDENCSSRQLGELSRTNNVVSKDVGFDRMSLEWSKPGTFIAVCQMDEATKPTACERSTVGQNGSTAVETLVSHPQRIVDKAAITSPQSPNKPGSAAAKKCFVGWTVRRTRFAMTGRAGSLRQTMLGRVGKPKPTNLESSGRSKHTTMGCTGKPKQSPGTSGKPKPNSPGTSGKPGHTIAGHSGNLRMAIPGSFGKPVQTTPRHAASPGTSGKPKTFTPGCASNARQTTLGCKTRSIQHHTRTLSSLTDSSLATAHDVGTSVPSPAVRRLVSSSPALKRNAKGETALHTAAIKVIASACFNIALLSMMAVFKTAR